LLSEWFAAAGVAWEAFLLKMQLADEETFTALRDVAILFADIRRAISTEIYTTTFVV